MPASYIGGKVPKLIIQDVFLNISRYSCAKKKIPGWVSLDSASFYIVGEFHCHRTIETSMKT
jgi:hypothetical protein